MMYIFVRHYVSFYLADDNPTMDKVDLDDIIEQAGGCGRFQVLLTLIIHSTKCIVCFRYWFSFYSIS